MENQRHRHDSLQCFPNVQFKWINNIIRINTIKKDKQNMLTPFEAARIMLDKKEFRKLKFWEKMQMFFIDFDFTPLLIQVKNIIIKLKFGVSGL